MLLDLGTSTHQTLTFHGLGGQGKTWLCKNLGQVLADDPSFSDVHWGTVNLHGVSERNPIYLALWIRNALSQSSKMAFPAFDFVYEKYRQASQRDYALPEAKVHWS